MLSFVGPVIAPALTIPAFAAAAQCVLMLFTAEFIVKPWFDEAFHKKRPWYRKFFKSAGSLIPIRPKLSLQRIKARLANQVALRLPPVSRYMHKVAGNWELVTSAILQTNQATLEALTTVRNVTIPQVVAGVLEPIRTRLDRHTDRLDVLEDLNRRIAVAVGDTLRALPWGVPGGLVSNWETFLGRFVQLWDHYWEVTRPYLAALAADVLPELRNRIEALERGAAGAPGAALGQIRQRLDTLERWRELVVSPALANLQAALDALSDEVFGPVGTGLLALIGRVSDLEAWREFVVTPALDALRAELGQLRTELEEGVETGLEAFRTRIEALELETFTNIPQRLAGMQLAIDTLAAEVFEEVGAGLAALTARIVELERLATVTIPAQIALVEQQVELLRGRIADEILPRIEGIEAILAPAAFAALVLATMRTAAPNLFCRNMTRVSEQVCRVDGGWIDDLLAVGLPLLILADLCAFARLIQAAAGGFLDIGSGLVLGVGRALDCGGSAPPTLPLNLTELPDTANAVAL